MPKVQHTCTLHEKTVQTLAVESPKRRRKTTTGRVRNSRVTTINKLDALDPMLRAYLKKHAIHPSRIEVRSPIEVVVR